MPDEAPVTMAARSLPGWWKNHSTSPIGGLCEHCEPVHRLTQHLGRRRTSSIQPGAVGQCRPVVGVGHTGGGGVDRIELPAPEVAGRLLSGFRRTPGDLAALDEFHDVVL